MLKNINPTQTQAWKALTAHFESAQDMDLKALLRKTASVLPNTLRALVRTFWSIIRKT